MKTLQNSQQTKVFQNENHHKNTVQRHKTLNLAQVLPCEANISVIKKTF